MEHQLDQEPRRKFTVEEVARMVEAGILTEDDRFELLAGELLAVTPQNPPHANTLYRLDERFRQVYRGGYVIRPQMPLLVSDESLPEPDLAVFRGDGTTFANRHPRGDESVIVVEVTWSTQQRDQAKSHIYALGGVPTYWRLDLESRILEVHDRPRKSGVYARTIILAEADEVTPPETDVTWKVSDLLP